MERKIGEIFEYNGEWYQCVKEDSIIGVDGIINYCEGCDISASECDNFNCIDDERSDKKLVIFKKLEKVGEPYNVGKKVFQRYEVFVKPYIFNDEFFTINTSVEDSYISIEIKQNKEDMEEKGQCCDNRFEIIAKAKEALLKETNIARDEQEMAVIDNILFRCWQMGWLDKYDDTKHSNSESIGKNLKPFDFEAAKLGKPVCTRDGRKARIICFDKKGAYPIVALVNYYNEKEYIKNYDKFGKKFINSETSDDLMMLPEKKEGWVNIYNTNRAYYYMSGNVFKTKDEAMQEVKYEIAIGQVKEEEYASTIKISWEE